MKANTQEELDLQIREKAEEWENQSSDLPIDKDSIWAKIESKRRVTPVLHRIRIYVIAASIALLFGVGWTAIDFVSSMNTKALVQNARILKLEQALQQKEELLALKPKEVIVRDTIVQTQIVHRSTIADASVQYEEQLRDCYEHINRLQTQNQVLSESMRSQIDSLSDSLQFQSDYITQMHDATLEKAEDKSLTLASNANVQINKINSSPVTNSDKSRKLEIQFLATRTPKERDDRQSRLFKEIEL